MANGKTDAFDQIIAMGVTMSAANTLTFSRVAIGVTLFDYAAFIISRIEYRLSRASVAELVASADSVTLAITGSASVPDIFDASDPRVYDSCSIMPTGSVGTEFQYTRLPLVADFSQMEGGGLIVPAQDVFLGMQTSGYANAGVATARVYYRAKSMAAADYLELAQRLRVLTSS